MKEQSHKEEMSSLLQEDFARLRARGVETTLAEKVEAPAPEPPSMLPVEAVEFPQAATPADGWLKRLLRAQ